jgi:multidrug efflux system membrane fusion protein
MPIFLTGLGTVTAYNSVTVKSRVDGQLISVTVREGQKVRKGQLLAQIDPEPYGAAVAQAEGQLARDVATAHYASVESERYDALFKAGVIAQNSQQLQAANAGQSAGAVEADKAAIRAAKVNLAYTRITSPIDGVVGLRQVDPGNLIHAADSTGLLLLTQVQPISVIFTLPEEQLPQVQQMLLKGVTLSVEAWDRSQTVRLATGKLVTLDNQVDVTTGTDKVKAVFDNRDNALFPNQFVNIRLILQQRADALVIPSAAIQSGSQGSFVYVMKKGDPPAREDGGAAKSGATGGGEHKHKHEAAATAASPAAEAPAPAAEADDPSAKSKPAEKKYYVEVRPIVIDVTEGSQVIIGSGLAAGEQVVIDGVEKLKNGSKVSPQKEGGSGKHSKGGGAKDPEAKGEKGAAEGAAPAGAEGAHKSHKDKTASAAAPAAGDAAPESGGHHHHHDHGAQP